MTNSVSTRGQISHAEFVAARKKYLGGSDIASVMNKGRYGCSRKLGYDKLDIPKDIDDSEKMEFRRGHRLEGIAAKYYEEITGRQTWISTTQSVPGKPHLSVNVDRFTAKKDDPGKKNWGYLEIKVMSRFSFLKAKKEGLIDDYLLQLQFGMAVCDLSWGAYAIYCPDLDDLITWDVEADKDLGDHLLESADDWWSFHVGCKVLPDPLPDDSAPCHSCPWSITCRGSLIQAPAPGITERPDLEPIVAKFAEIKGMGSEVDEASDSLRAEILEAIGEKPGTYRAGRYEFSFAARAQKRFNSDKLKKMNPELYESLREESIVKTLGKPKEI